MTENNLRATAVEKTAECFKQILLANNIDLEDPNFKETPLRAAKAFTQFLRGYKESEITAIFRKHFPTQLSQMLIVRAVPVYGFCPHHLLPVEMRVWIGYIPNKKALGLSKFNRLTKILSQSALLQEEMTEIIAEKTWKHLKPLGVMVVVDGHHMCMSMRGIEHQDSKVTTSAIRGNFQKHEIRAEFLSLIEADRK